MAQDSRRGWETSTIGLQALSSIIGDFAPQFQYAKPRILLRNFVQAGSKRGNRPELSFGSAGARPARREQVVYTGAFRPRFPQKANDLGQKPEWLPYFGPMLAFAVILAAADYVEGYDSALLGLRVAAPLLLFLFFLSRGCYPELKGYRPGAAGALADMLLGLLVAVVWIAPFMIWVGLRPDPSEAFDANMAGETLRPLMLGLRFAGFVVVTPFIEELLVRSYLIRAVELYPQDRDFREIPVGTFAWRSFLVTVAWFTLTHAPWEWKVALPAGVLYNLWLYRRKHLGSLIVAHAVTNAALFWLVVYSSGRAGGDRLWDLWFFL